MLCSLPAVNLAFKLPVYIYGGHHKTEAETRPVNLDSLVCFNELITLLTFVCHDKPFILSSVPSMHLVTIVQDPKLFKI